MNQKLCLTFILHFSVQGSIQCHGILTLKECLKNKKLQHVEIILFVCVCVYLWISTRQRLSYNGPNSSMSGAMLKTGKYSLFLYSLLLHLFNAITFSHLRIIYLIVFECYQHLFVYEYRLMKKYLKALHGL